MKFLTQITFILLMVLVSACSQNVTKHTDVEKNVSQKQVRALTAIGEQHPEISKIVAESLSKPDLEKKIGGEISFKGLTIKPSKQLINPDDDICSSCLTCDSSGNCSSTAQCCSKAVLGGCNDPCHDGDYCPLLSCDAKFKM